MGSRARSWTLGALALCLSGPLCAQTQIYASGFDEPSEGPYNKAQAARFLTQASFGPTLSEIDRLARIGYNAWLSDQSTRPISLQLPFLDALIQQAIAAGQPIEVWQDKRQEIWWKNALQNSDQLRQRMAFALSQILVIFGSEWRAGRQSHRHRALLRSAVDQRSGQLPDAAGTGDAASDDGPVPVDVQKSQTRSGAEHPPG
ncbi:MAG: DUF1800 family protein [Rhodanobacteraceae bacterium]|nr:DUF1800 family protein [Rhodanobacteraceae bacterium]